MMRRPAPCRSLEAGGALLAAPSPISAPMSVCVMLSKTRAELALVLRLHFVCAVSHPKPGARSGGIRSRHDPGGTVQADVAIRCGDLTQRSLDSVENDRQVINADLAHEAGNGSDLQHAL